MHEWEGQECCVNRVSCANWIIPACFVSIVSRISICKVLSWSTKVSSFFHRDIVSCLIPIWFAVSLADRPVAKRCVANNWRLLSFIDIFTLICGVTKTAVFLLLFNKCQYLFTWKKSMSYNFVRGWKLVCIHPANNSGFTDI